MYEKQSEIAEVDVFGNNAGLLFSRRRRHILTVGTHSKVRIGVSSGKMIG
jgi:hypothetical protein